MSNPNKLQRFADVQNVIKCHVASVQDESTATRGQCVYHSTLLLASYKHLLSVCAHHDIRLHEHSLNTLGDEGKCSSV